MRCEGSLDVAVLAGGRSSRMGRDKALLTIEGVTLLARQVALAWALSPAEVWVVGRSEAEVRGLRARALEDDVPDQGPLGGLATVLRATSAEHVLLLGVDLPALTAGLLRALLGARAPGVGVVPRLRGRWEPVVAVYPGALAAPARAAVADGRRSMHAFVEEAVRAGRLVPLEVGADEERLLVNWNVPADVARG